MFGDQLLICPVTSKINPRTKKAATKLYLPEGRWTNIFNGKIYDGGQEICAHSFLTEMPVFAKEGAIIPFSEDQGNGAANPEKMLWRIYRGNNDFLLYEDDGETNDYRDGDVSFTTVVQTYKDNRLTLTIKDGQEAPYMPNSRQHTLLFGDIVNAKEVRVTVNGKEVSFEKETKDDALKIRLEAGKVSDEICVTLDGVEERCNPDYLSMVYETASRFNANNAVKSVMFALFKHGKLPEDMARKVRRVRHRALREELLEILEQMK